MRLQNVIGTDEEVKGSDVPMEEANYFSGLVKLGKQIDMIAQNEGNSQTRRLLDNEY